MRQIAALLLAFSLITLAACKREQAGSETEDGTNPFFRQAAKFEADQNYNAAIKEYEGALRANPMAAKAHLHIGVIYSERIGDPVSSIYHFQRYLQARPNAADKDQVQTYIDKAKIDFLINHPNSPIQNAEEIAKIGKENIDLKQALTQAQMQLAEKDGLIAQLQSGKTVAPSSAVPAVVTANAEPTVTTTTPVSAKVAPANVTAQPLSATAPAASAPVATATTTTAPAPAVSAEGARSHVIQRGDSLWKIASKYYPGEVVEGIEKIKQANPQATSNERNLKLGDTLVIP